MHQVVDLRESGTELPMFIFFMITFSNLRLRYSIMLIRYLEQKLSPYCRRLKKKCVWRFMALSVSAWGLDPSYLFGLIPVRLDGVLPCPPIYITRVSLDFSLLILLTSPRVWSTEEARHRDSVWWTLMITFLSRVKDDIDQTQANLTLGSAIFTSKRLWILCKICIICKLW